MAANVNVVGVICLTVQQLVTGRPPRYDIPGQVNLEQEAEALELFRGAFNCHQNQVDQ